MADTVQHDTDDIIANDLSKANYIKDDHHIIAMDTSAGHDHDGTDSKKVATGDLTGHTEAAHITLGLADLNTAQTLSEKTLTTPTIGSFTNSAHDHEDVAGGATLDHGLALTGLTDDDHTIYLKAAGGRNWTLPTPSDDDAEGIIISGTAGENLVIGDVVYLKAADSKWWKADADAETTTKPMLAISIGSITADASGNLLLKGLLRDDSGYALTVGAPYFVSTTVGAITATAPSGTGDIVRVVGYALTADILFFNPSDVWLEIT